MTVRVMRTDEDKVTNKVTDTVADLVADLVAVSER